MSILISILLVIAAIVVILLILALFSKKSYALERSVTINKPVREVFDYLRHLRNQDQFNKWVMTDPNKKTSFTGTDGTVGFTYAWNGNKQAGEGEQQITKLEQDRRIDIEVRFIRPFPAIASTPFTMAPINDNETKVTWGMNSTMKYPMNVMLLFMNMDSLLGKDVEASLATLKNIIEKK